MDEESLAFIHDYCQLLAAQFTAPHATREVAHAAFHQAVGTWNHETRAQAWATASDFNATLQLGNRPISCCANMC